MDVTQIIAMITQASSNRPVAHSRIGADVSLDRENRNITNTAIRALRSWGTETNTTMDFDLLSQTNSQDPYARQTIITAVQRAATEARYR